MNRSGNYKMAVVLERAIARKIVPNGKSGGLFGRFTRRYPVGMESSRRPRFTRSQDIVPVQLTERDRQIIRLIHRYRFLRSSQIVALIGGSHQQLLRRLQVLYHHGFLDRPRAQIDYYHQGGSRHIVYGLGNKGAEILKRERRIAFRHLRWSEKNRSVGRIYLEHALLVSDMMVALELACRETGRIRLLAEDELFVGGERHRQSLRWKVKVAGGIQLGVIPDRVFGLEFPDQNGKADRAYFLLEADRGTMPITRHSLSQTSFFRKLLAYEATWSHSIHRSHFGFHRFRVLTVTKSAERVNSLIEACAQLKRGHGLFLFADSTVLEKPLDLFSPVWRTGRAGETASLLN